MTIREFILSMLDDEDVVIFLEPAYFDSAILGLTSNSPGWDTPPRVCYSSDKILEALVREEGMQYEEALDYFFFNIQGLGMSAPPPPMLVQDFDIDTHREVLDARREGNTNEGLPYLW